MIRSQSSCATQRVHRRDCDGWHGSLRKERAEALALIVLDLRLPRTSGLEVCKLLKTDSLTSHIPIIMLTVKAEDMDRIVSLGFGADDCVTKPFGPREMLLRIRAIRRRPGDSSQEKLTRGPIRSIPRNIVCWSAASRWF